MSLKRKIAIFTMDMEAFADTECIQYSNSVVENDMLDGLDEYINLLDKYGIKATLFAMSDAAVKVKDKLKKYISNGHCLALHGKEHIAPTLQSPNEFRSKTQDAKNQLEELFEVKIKGYRAPCFALDNERLDILSELGFQYDSSRFDFPQRRHAAEIDTSNFEKLSDNIFRRSGFYEFGMPCEKWCGFRLPVSGGGYARLGNWTFFRSILHQYLRHNDYYVFYLHPFEISKIPAPRLPKLKSYDKYYLSVGTKNYAKKIETIIKMLRALGFEFATFEELAERLETEEN